MLDLIEKVKLVQGVRPTTMGAADSGDWVTMKNAHTVWAIISADSATTSITITPKLASSFAGTGSSAITGGAKFWVNTNTSQLDRLTASTRSTAYTLANNTNCAMIVVKYDPANAASSNTHFSIDVSTCAAANVGRYSVIYAIEPRYAGYQQTIATTSST